MPTVEHPDGTTPESTEIKSDLTAFYDERAATRADSALTPDRTLARGVFGDLLLEEGRSLVVDVGAGTGQDATALMALGVRVIALDLSSEHCRWLRKRGAMPAVADLYHLPLATRSVSSLWSVSAFQHVPQRDIAAVIEETARVMQVGAPAMIGVWTGDPVEETRIDGDVRRFYSIRSAAEWRAQFGRVLGVERWWTDDGFDHGGYLWLLARRR